MKLSIKAPVLRHFGFDTAIGMSFEWVVSGVLSVLLFWVVYFIRPVFGFIL